MATNFVRTDVIQGRRITEEGAPPVYTVFVDGVFRGWVSGGQRSFRFLAENGYEWGPEGATRAKAVERHDARIEADRKAQEWRSQQVPTEVKVLRLTAENIYEEGNQLVGWMISGAEDLGEITSARLTRDGYDNAMLVGNSRRDVLGLPSDITAYKL